MNELNSNTKTCSRCGSTKSKHATICKRFLSGFRYRCKPCERLKAAKWRALNKEGIIAKSKIQYNKNRDYNCQKSRGCRFRQKYWPSLSYKDALAEWNKLFSAQKGRCEICRRQKPLDVDHDHLSGKVRALLCNGCNTAIARLEESVEIALNAINYIKRHRVSI